MRLYESVTEKLGHIPTPCVCAETPSKKLKKYRVTMRRRLETRQSCEVTYAEALKAGPHKMAGTGNIIS